MVLGIVGLTVCGLCGPFALIIGRNAVREIDASGGRQGGRGMAQAGYIMGIITTVLIALGLVFFVIVLITAAARASR
jgi:uncharacterized membrane protein